MCTRLGYLHLIVLTTFSVQLIGLGCVHSLSNQFSVQQFWVGKVLHLVSLRVSFSRRNLSVQQVSCVRISLFPLLSFFFNSLISNSHIFPVIFTWRKPENLVTTIKNCSQGETIFPRGDLCNSFPRGVVARTFCCFRLSQTALFLDIFFTHPHEMYPSAF
jgi:hypothetical protein